MYKNLAACLSLGSFIGLASSAYAGSSTANIACKSDSGRTTLDMRIWDLTDQLEDAKFTIDGETIAFDQEADVRTISSLEDGVLTVSMEVASDDQYYFLKFWALPQTVNIDVNTRPSLQASFQAKVFGTDPRPNESRSPAITLGCTLDYTI